ncbi:MAG: methyl-accepting chemotaxis protein [Gaiellales bacterium]|nr:MAG: methyl-accepting chemotaxis protein [Gaiellales bacterium]
MAVEGMKKPINRDSFSAMRPEAYPGKPVTGGEKMKRINFLTSRIELKILSLVALILSIGFGVFGYVNINHERQTLTEQQEVSNHNLASSVATSLKTSMLVNNAALTVQAVDDLRGGEVEQIRIFGNDGQEAFLDGGGLSSATRSELAQVLDSGETAVFYEGEGADRVMSEILPLQNEQSCQQCHDSKESLRGAVLVSTATDRMDSALADNTYLTVFALVLTLVTILVTLKILLNIAVLKPLKDVVGAIKRIAAGDLTEQVPVKSSDELGQLAVNFNEMTRNLRNLSYKIIEVGEQSTAASAEISATVEQQASASAEQSSAVAETTATIEELAGTAKQIAETSKSVAEVASETLNHAEDGQEAVAATINGMHMIKSKVNKVAEKTLTLGEKSQRIGTILEIINDIADQTNLLALNAAVEAARAGDQGRGFAVVAGEVRRLAEESVEATTKIKALIDEIQSETNSTIIATEESTKEAERGVTLAKNAGKSLDSIVSVVVENTNAAKEISIATQQQKSASEQVVVAMTNISEASKQQASGAKQTASAAEQLNRIAADLKAAISSFKVD